MQLQTPWAALSFEFSLSDSAYRADPHSIWTRQIDIGYEQES